VTTRTAYCLLDTDGRMLAAEDERRPFYAASTVKLALMAAVARAVDAGELTWADELTVRTSFPSGAAGAPPFEVPVEDRDERMPAEGTPLSVLEIVHAMIRRSSNEATNLLAGAVGLSAVGDILRTAGDQGCRMERLIGDLAAAGAGATNEVTAHGLARLMAAVVGGTLASPAATRVMIETLEGQELATIAEVLRPGTPWGSKSGWVEHIDHDVAFVGGPGTASHRILAVCTSGFPGRSGQDEIRRVATALLAESNCL